MRFTLKEYQNDAVGQMLTNLADAHDDVHRKRRNVAFSLSATTGAGKTVMASAVIEALFLGNDDWNFTADPGAVVLWFSDSPSLNEQTRSRILEASGDRLAHSQLEVITNTFNRQRLEPSKVYFLNAQLLAKGNHLVRGAEVDESNTLVERSASPDLREHTIWQTIRNTIEDDTLTLYLILDEAHKGMRPATTTEERQTIVRRLINGTDAGVPIPVVWGISATIDRFTKAMAGVEGRTTYPPYEVDPALIQESGLLKDDIRLDFPAETGEFDLVLLRRGVEKLKASTALWTEYAQAQEISSDVVEPLLVVQVPNKVDDATLAQSVRTIRETWPELGKDAIAHVFGEHTALDLPTGTIRYVRPESVQDRTHIRVLFAKDAISTGWDCPRAEVLVSFRPASDRTHITQLLGRMVRTPLARRIAGHDLLNSVECVLPRFNRATAEDVALVLRGKRGGDDTDGTGGTGGGDGRRVLYKPIDMLPNAAIAEDVWAVLDELPSQTLPRKAAKPTKRLTALAQALSRDQLLPDARKHAYRDLFGVLDGLRARFKEQLEAASFGILTVEGETLVASVGGEVRSEVETFTERADEAAVEAEFKAAQRILSPDIARKYADELAGDDDEQLFDAHLTVAALARIPEVQDELDRAASTLCTKWFTEHRVKIKELSEDRQAVYAEIRSMSTEPQRTDIQRPRVRSEETETADGTPVDSRPGHLMSREDGQFPIGSLGSWEVAVLDREASHSGFRAWYRNPSRASADALAIAYQSGTWRRMCPDFIFFHDVAGQVRASIVDPHSYHLADALPKLRGLADFALAFGHEFHRIEGVAEVEGGMRVLDMLDSAVRTAVTDAASAEQLYRSSVAVDY